MNRKNFSVLFLILALVTLLTVDSPLFSKSKEKNKDIDAKLGDSHHFFSFSDAPYFTSPDKRIGVKLLIDSNKVGPAFSSMQHVTLLPKAEVKRHRHVFVTEILYILKGNLTIRVEKETKVLGPDCTAYIPPKEFHEFLNDSMDVCQFLQFYSPSGPEEEYRNWEKPTTENATKTASVTLVATQPKEIVQPKMGPIPGSPRTLLGTVTEVNSEKASQTKEIGQPLKLRIADTPETQVGSVKNIPSKGTSQPTVEDK
ncbi:MAG: cupin domain-containing protein [Candidatus Riflebacteria bacterium]|nr:cupin domain-containing protein [Candidatus Riflebacteria bacterium]